jgi:hypothetical protein
MFKLTLLALALTACAAPMKQTIDQTKLKPNERAYSGNVQVDLNGLTNDKVTCELFLNSDLNATIRVSPDGNYTFKSIKKKLAFSKIACIYKLKNEKHWIYHSLDLQRISQPDETKAKEVYDLGGLKIIWKVNDSEIAADSTNVFGSEDKMKDVGELTVKPADNAKPASPQL